MGGGGCCPGHEGYEGEEGGCSSGDEGYEGEKRGRSASNEGYEGVSRRQVCRWGLHRSTCLASCFAVGHVPTALTGSRGARPALGRYSLEVTSCSQRLSISVNVAK